MNTSTVLVRALLAYSVHEHQDGTATQNEAPEIDCDGVLAQVEIWRTAHPGLKIDVVCPEQHAL